MTWNDNVKETLMLTLKISEFLMYFNVPIILKLSFDDSVGDYVNNEKTPYSSSLIPDLESS